jgi:hypothetical protein
MQVEGLHLHFPDAPFSLAGESGAFVFLARKLLIGALFGPRGLTPPYLLSDSFRNRIHR